MWYALSWFGVLVLLALWSLAAWAANAVAVWTISNAGALTGAASGAMSGAASGAEKLLLPEWLAPWVPAEFTQALSTMLAGLAPYVESLVQATPALSTGFTTVVWVIWGLGAALLVLLGVGLHVVIAMWRRRDGGSGPPQPRQMAA